MGGSLYRQLMVTSALAAAMMQDPYGYRKDDYLNPMNAYEPPKVSGFTECKGRKHLSKKKRKQLKNKSK